MKSILCAALSLFSFAALAQDMAVFHQEICSRGDIKEMKGEKGSCRIVITHEKSEETQGVCRGTIGKSLPCQVTYLVNERATGIQLLCGKDFQKPDVKQLLVAKADTHKVAAVVGREDGTQKVIPDNTAYTSLTSPLMTFILLKNEDKVNAEMIVNLKSGPMAMTNVECL